jgi:hypothetical protein
MLQDYHNAGILVLLEHLPVLHLNRQEDHNKRRQPDTTRSQPKDTRAFRSEKLRTGVRGDNSS